MNVPNPLRSGNARLFSAELSAAAHLEARSAGRRIMLGWYHRATAARVATCAAALLLTAVVFPSAGSTIAVIGIALAVYTRIAFLSHQVLNEGNGHCPHCPPAEDDHGDGGQRFRHGGGTDIPPAPAPMPDLDDERIAAIAGDLDAQLLDLVADVRHRKNGSTL